MTKSKSENLESLGNLEFSKLLCSQLPVFRFLIDNDGNLQKIEGKALTMGDFDSQEFTREDVFHLFFQEEKLKNLVKKALQGETICSVPYFFYEKFEVSLAPIKDKKGKIIGVTGFGVSVSQAQSMEQALKEKNSQYKTLTEAAQEYIFLIGPDFEIQFVNKFSAENFGKTTQEVLGQNLSRLFPPEMIDRLIQELQAVFESGAPANFESRIGSDDCHRWLDVRLVQMKDLSELPIGVLGIARDITKRKKIEEDLRLTQYSVDHSSEAVFWLDRNGRFVVINQATCNSLGYSKNELLSMQIFDIDPTFRENLWDQNWERFKNQALTIESVHRRRDGQVFPVEIHGTILTFSDQELLCIFSRNISERRKAQEQLFHEKERLRITLQSIGDGVIAVDTLGKIVLMNPAAEKLTGHSFSDLESTKINEVLVLIDEEKRAFCPCFHFSSRSFEHHFPGSFYLVSKTGKETLVSQTSAKIKDSAGKVLGGVCVLKDITQLRHFENELQKARRLEAIGILAGGLSHDFNNLLTVLLGNVSLAKIYAREDEKTLRKLEDSESAAAKIKDLVKELISEFHMYLPANPGGVIPLSEPDSTPPKKGTGKILLMDDDPLIREVVLEILKDLGYQPTVVDSGAEAVRAYQESLDQGAPYRAVILDLTVPGGMGGKETLMALKQIDPEVKAIVSSGYPGEEVLQDFREAGFVGIIPKPYSQEELGTQLHDILSSFE